MKFGVALGALNAHFHLDAVDAADARGYESVWLPEHLVFPTTMSSSPKPGEEHPPVPPTTPVFDAFTYLAFVGVRRCSVDEAVTDSECFFDGGGSHVRWGLEDTEGQRRHLHAVVQDQVHIGSPL